MDIPFSVQLALAILSIVGSCLSSIVLASWASFLRRREAEETERVKREDKRDEQVARMERHLIKAGILPTD